MHPSTLLKLNNNNNGLNSDLFFNNFTRFAFQRAHENGWLHIMVMKLDARTRLNVVNIRVITGPNSMQ